MVRSIGKIKTRDHSRGWGFITPNSVSEDVFIHVTSLPQNTILNIGDRISYETQVTARGTKAINAQRVDHA